MKLLQTNPRAAFVYLLMAFILLSYAVLRIANLSEAVQKVKSTADTTSYLRISKESVFGAQFVANSRPFIFPLALKILRGNAEAVAWGQGIFSIVSWGSLAVALAYSLQVFFLRLMALGLILLLSLYRYVLAWDSVLLTESISLSLMALFIAGWLWLLKEWRGYKVILLSLVALLWTFSRDTNAWVILMVALLLLLLFGLRQIDKKYLILSGVFLVLFLLSNLSADVGGRWIFPFQNVLGRRLLSDRHAVGFFANCGMPVSPALLQLAGGYANSADRAFYEDPALEEYRLWLYESGKDCYIKWLLADPWESISQPFTEFNSLMSMQNIQPFLFSSRFSPILPARLEAILFPQRQLLFIFILLSGMTLLAILTKAWRQNKAWWVIIALNLLVFPHYFITWHGDVMGIYRHVLAVSIQFYLGMWFLVLLGLDSVFSLKSMQEGQITQLLMRSLKHSRNTGS
jgi:hypothetical protein